MYSSKTISRVIAAVSGGAIAGPFVVVALELAGLMTATEAWVVFAVATGAILGPVLHFSRSRASWL